MPLSWIEANLDSVQRLRGFECAYPAYVGRRDGEITHPRPYQIVVESFLQEFQPPRELPPAVLVGEDDLGIAVICAYSYVEYGDIPPSYFINALARARRCYGTDYAQQALTETLQRLRDRNARHGNEYGVYGKVDNRNRASLRLLRANGFERFAGDSRFDFMGRDL
ncbi:hypothetical protein [Microbacterium lacus]|uniref:N-acetyltransferase domain-containing protein n=1 Tax=Microbacterium lacus TaxID=415217 RepID=A0ABP4SW91_9MICO